MKDAEHVWAFVVRDDVTKLTRRRFLRTCRREAYSEMEKPEQKSAFVNLLHLFFFFFIIENIFHVFTRWIYFIFELVDFFFSFS